MTSIAFKLRLWSQRLEGTDLFLGKLAVVVEFTDTQGLVFTEKQRASLRGPNISVPYWYPFAVHNHTNGLERLLRLANNLGRSTTLGQMASKLVNALTPKDPYVDMPEITYDVTMKSSETEIVEGLNHALLTDPSSDAQTTLLGDFERRLQVLTLAIDQYPMYGNPTDIPTGHTTVMAIKFLGSAATEFGQLIYETMSFSQYLNVPLSTAIVSLLHKSFGYTAAEIHADPTLETAMNTKFLRHLGGVDLMSAKLPITKDTLLRASKESLVQTVHQWLARFQQKAKALSSAKIISLKETLHNAMFSMRSRTTTS